MTRLKTCKHCGKLHSIADRCDKAPYRTRKRTEFDRMRGLNVWKKKRSDVKNRDHELCRWCLYKYELINFKARLSVHHIVPMEEDIDKWLDDNNLITLCSLCHEEAEQGRISREELIGLAKVIPYIKTKEE